MSGKNKTNDSPISSLQAKLFFVFLCISSVVVFKIACGHNVNIGLDNREKIIAIYIFILSYLITSYSLGASFYGILKYIVYQLILFTPIVVSNIFYPSSVLLAVSYIILVIWTVGAVRCNKEDEKENSFLNYCYVLWVITGGYIGAAEVGLIELSNDYNNGFDRAVFEYNWTKIATDGVFRFYIYDLRCQLSFLQR
jgi:hypothetical protein